MQFSATLRSAGVCSLLWDVRRALLCLALPCLALPCLALLCTHAKLVSHSYLTAMLWHNMCISARLGLTWPGVAWRGRTWLGTSQCKAVELLEVVSSGLMDGLQWFDGWTAVFRSTVRGAVLCCGSNLFYSSDTICDCTRLVDPLSD